MKLRQLDIKGFKSIAADTGQSIPLGDVTVLLGANGSGKSCFLSFFELLNALGKHKLSDFIAKNGGANQLLHYGQKMTDSIVFNLHFTDMPKSKHYGINLLPDVQGRMYIEKESVHEENENERENFLTNRLGESAVLDTHTDIGDYLINIRTYHFQDTSDTAKIKNRIYRDDAYYLHHDAGNLAAFLAALKNNAERTKYYLRIVRHIRQVMPQFDDFELTPLPDAPDYVKLNWRDVRHDYMFGPHQISDGSLRFMALTALLLQPPDLMPSCIVIDEPELGLHPLAVDHLASMFKEASQYTQIILATQSTNMVDSFEPEDIIVVENEHGCSGFKSLDPDRLAEWLQRYSLSELWEKNVLGGQP
jgi:predicted ATPase